MGFSVSGATAIVLIGGLIAFSFAFSAASNGFERVADAQSDQEERLLDQQNTAIEVANASYDAGTLTVGVNNTGSTELDVGETSLLVDGEYEPNATTSVDGDGSTSVWLPGEQLRFEVDRDSQPARVKVVTGIGVSDTLTEVT